MGETQLSAVRNDTPLRSNYPLKSRSNFRNSDFLVPGAALTRSPRLDRCNNCCHTGNFAVVDFLDNFLDNCSPADLLTCDTPDSGIPRGLYPCRLENYVPHGTLFRRRACRHGLGIPAPDHCNVSPHLLEGGSCTHLCKTRWAHVLAH